MAETKRRWRLPSKRKLTMLAMMFVVMLAMLEVGLRLVVFQTESLHTTALGQAYYTLRNETFVPGSVKYTRDKAFPRPKPRYRPDPLVGYVSTPGIYAGTRSFDFLWFLTSSHYEKQTIAEDGYRVTSADPSRYEGKPEIHVYGCSYTYGHALRDEETFAWQIQEEFPSHRVRNFAQGGFGNVQGYLQLKQACDAGEPPAVAVFVYNPFHMYRNIGTPSWLGRNLRGSSERKASVARFGASGRLEFSLATIEPRKGPDPSIHEIQGVTMQLFAEVAVLCKKHDVKPILAVQSGSGCEDNRPSLQQRKRNRCSQAAACDPVALTAKRRGFLIVNMMLSHHDDECPPYYRVSPPDPHPNARGHAYYAEKLITGLRQLGIE